MISTDARRSQELVENRASLRHIERGPQFGGSDLLLTTLVITLWLIPIHNGRVASRG